MAERSPQLGHDYGHRLYTPTSLARELGSQAAVIVGTGGLPQRLQKRRLDYTLFVDPKATARSVTDAMKPVVRNVATLRRSVRKRKSRSTPGARELMGGLDTELKALVTAEAVRESRLDATVATFLHERDAPLSQVMASRVLGLLNQTVSSTQGLDALRSVPALDQVGLFTWLAPFNEEQAAKAERQALRNLGELRGPGYVVERVMREEQSPDITLSEGEDYWTSHEVFREALVLHPDLGHATVIGERRTITYPDENGKPVTSFISRSQSLQMTD